MGEKTAISWCDHTFNPWVGCQKVGPACDGCYAWAQQDVRFSRVVFGGPGKGVGTRSRTSDGYWRQPHRWNRIAAETGTTPFVFGGSLMDPFDKHVDPAWRRDYFDQVIRPTPNLVWLLLTKRPELIVELSEDAGGLPPNVALGTTAEDREHWDHRVGELLAAKAVLDPVFAFASLEPLLGPIHPRSAKVTGSMRRLGYFAPTHVRFDPLHPHLDRRLRLDWIITGGESDQADHKARPTHPDWFRFVRDACADTGTPYHHKQNGEWVSVSEVDGDGDHYSFPDYATVRKVGKHRSGRLLDGVLHDARPRVAA
jgi:protein gp37